MTLWCSLTPIGQHRPELPLLLWLKQMVNEGANIVIASRFVTKARGNSPREIGSKLISWLIKTSTGQTITDPTSGMRMYDRGLIETYARSFDFSPEPDTISLLMRRGAKVVEIETEMRERQGGESYLSFYNSIMYIGSHVPLAFCSSSGLDKVTP